MAGLDLSPELVALSRQLHPDIPFEQGDFRKLPVSDQAWAGIVALYSIIHLDPDEVTPTLREWRRVVRPDGLLLLAVHLGQDPLHLDEWWGRKVNVDFHFFQTPDLLGCLQNAGWRLDEVTERDPYPDVEHPTRRLYVLARAG
jgi:SAM-dependent methyltransferase